MRHEVLLTSKHYIILDNNILRCRKWYVTGGARTYRSTSDFESYGKAFVDDLQGMCMWRVIWLVTVHMHADTLNFQVKIKPSSGVGGAGTLITPLPPN